MSAADTLPAKLPPPGKLAVIECEPAVSEVMVKVAIPCPRIS
jgi:hypothetical protein